MEHEDTREIKKRDKGESSKERQVTEMETQPKQINIKQTNGKTNKHKLVKTTEI